MKKPQLAIPSALHKLSSRVGSKPVFNQPVHTEKRYHVTRALYAVLLTLLVTFAISVLVLKAMTINFIEDNRDTGFEFQIDGGDAIVLAALPKQLYTAPAKLALVASAVSIFGGLAHLTFVFFDWKAGRKTQAYAFRRNTMFLHFFNTIFILLALISLFVTHKSSSHFRERFLSFFAERPLSSDDVDGGLRYGFGTFDLETWSCELATVPGAGMVQEDYSKQCQIDNAGRGMMIGLLVLGVAVAGLSIWGMVGRRDADGERIKTEQVELEMGKMNAL